MKSYLSRMILAALLALVPAAFLQAGVNGNPGGARKGKFARIHPRRNEVNARLANQRRRINQGVKNGRLTPAQAQQLRANDQAIKSQEKADLKANEGFLTKPEQKQLNQEENANSKLIFDEKHPEK